MIASVLNILGLPVESAFREELHRRSRGFVRWIGVTLGCFEIAFLFSDQYLIGRWTMLSLVVRTVSAAALFLMSGISFVSKKNFDSVQWHLMTSVLIIGQAAIIPAYDSIGPAVFGYAITLSLATLVLHYPPYKYVATAVIGTSIAIYTLFHSGKEFGTGEQGGYTVVVISVTLASIVIAILQWKKYVNTWSQSQLITEQQDQLMLQARNLEEEFALAAIVQQGVLPRLNSVQKRHFDYRYYPSGLIGGDILDIIPIDDENFSVFIADVSGHGVAAALLASMVKMAIRQLPPEQLLDPSGILTELNFTVFTLGNIANHFVTALCCVVNVRTRQITLASAGHDPLLVLNTKSGALRAWKPPGRALGFIPDAVYTNSVKTMPPHIKLIFYTDGCFEYTRMDGTQNKFSHFAAIIKKRKDLPIDLFIKTITVQINEEIDQSHYYDDISIIGVSLA